MRRSELARIVIVGCGFGGLFAARALRRTPADVLVIDRNNYHLFQPLLYQVASAALAPADIAQPIRTILRYQRNTRVMLAQVDEVDLTARQIRAGGMTVGYDYLVLAPGAVDNYFGHDEWRHFAPGMKAVEEATFIRSRLLRSFESAEIEADPEARAAHLTFIIVGAGPTGVELAGAIKELAVDVIPRDYRVADTRHARVVLIEAGPRVLPALHPDSSARALAQLRTLHVEVRLGMPVTRVLPDGVEVAGERLRSFNVIWTAGVRAAPLAASLGMPLGPGGRVKVAPDCSLPGHPELFVVGDAMALSGLPGLAEVAMQSGHHAARTIVRRLRGREAKPFRYLDLGTMATIARFRAVATVGRLQLSGFLAWAMWLVVHLTFLTGFKNRGAALANWVVAFIGRGRRQRTITKQQVFARTRELESLNGKPATPIPQLEKRDAA